MKTSNKLLLGFASLVILIPIIVMAFVSKIYYKEKPKSLGYVETFIQSRAINSTVPGLTDTKYLKSFNSINFENTNYSRIKLIINKSDNKYGIKIPAYAADNIRLTIVNNTLNIHFNKNVYLSGKDANLHTFVLYMPAIETVKVNKVDEFWLVANSPSLNIEAKKCATLQLMEYDITGAIAAKSNQHTNTFVNGFETLKLKLDSSGVYITNLNFKTLQIDAKPGSLIDINGGNNQKLSYKIENLIINSEGDNQLKISNITLENVKNKLSDLTKIEAATPILKQLFKAS